MSDVVLEVITNFPLYRCREFIEFRTVLEFATLIITRAVPKVLGADAAKGGVIHSWFGLRAERIGDDCQYGINMIERRQCGNCRQAWRRQFYQLSLQSSGRWCLKN